MKGKTNVKKPPSRKWKINENPKAIEYKEKINSQSDVFQRIAVGILILLLLIFYGAFSYEQELAQFKERQLLIQDLNYVADTYRIEEKQKKIDKELKSLKKSIRLKLNIRDQQIKPKQPNEVQTFKEIQAIERGVDYIDLEKEDTIEQKLIKQKLVRDLDDRLKEIYKYLRDLDKEDNEKSESIKNKRQKINSGQQVYTQLDALRDQADITKNKIGSELLRLERDLLKLKMIPFTTLKIVGDEVNVQVPEEAKLPYFLLPILWSLLLFSFILLWEGTRFSIITLYAGIIRRSLEIKEITKSSDELIGFLDNNTEELIGIPQCGCWWLAPLPRYDGKCLRADELRAALGWKNVHTFKVMVVSTFSIVFIIAQLEILDFLNTIEGFFNIESWFQIFSTIEKIIAYANIYLILNSLLAFNRVPDFGMKQEEGIQLDRRIFLRLGLLFLMAKSPLLYQDGKEKLNSIHLFSKRNPRYRPKVNRHLCITDNNFKSGLYQNTRIYKNTSTKILHYLTKLSIDQPMRRNNKNRRVPFKTQAEENLNIAKVDAWRRSGGITLRPQRNRIKSFEIKKLKINKHTENCKDLMFRDVGSVPMKNIKLIEDNEVLILLKNLNKGIGSKRNWTIGQSKKPVTLKFRSKRFVFVVEQHVLQHLDSSPLHQDKIEYLCDFLFEAIKLIGPELKAIKLIDLLAALSFRHKNQMFDKLQRKTAEYAKVAPESVEFSERIKHWSNPDGNWQKRWLDKPSDDPKYKKLHREKWANLPM